MAWWETLLLIAITHNWLGFIGALYFPTLGFEFVNPIWIHEHYRVNVFGTVLLCLSANLLCPLGSIIYWIYKLCTIGMKK